MIRIPGMIMVGAGGRNVGKTELVCALIQRFAAHHRITALKVTTVSETDGRCPRGGEGCGVCTSFEGAYFMTEETSAPPDKDTGRLLSAGAARVFWLRVRENHLVEGIEALREAADPDALTVCESNSLRSVVHPDLFLMVRDWRSATFKPTAERVRDCADRIVRFNGERFDLDFDELSIVHGQWALREPATAIILAGGNSIRMGRDKALLPVGGRPMIERVFAQLRPHFEQVIVGADDPEKFAFLGVDVVPDEVPGQGPLMGIASTLEAARHDLAVVVACDMPTLDVAFLRTLMRASHGYDCVVPVTPEGHYEPLLAVYKKGALPAIRWALASGRRKIIDFFPHCKVKCVELTNADWLENVNTMKDYEEPRPSGA